MLQKISTEEVEEKEEREERERDSSQWKRRYKERGPVREKIREKINGLKPKKIIKYLFAL